MGQPVRPAASSRLLDPQAMLVFAALAREKGVRRAAMALGLPRSTVSRRLAELERAIGARLVVRTPRRFELTEIGDGLSARCRALEELLRASEDLVQIAAVEPAGPLRVAVAPVLGEEVLPSVFAELLRRHPRLSLDIRLSPDYVDLRRGDVDVAVRTGPLDDATDLFATRLGTSTTGLYVSPGYARDRGVPRAAADLALHDCIVTGSVTPASWPLRFGARDRRVPVLVRARVDSFRVARDMAAEGAGILRTARIYARELVERGALVPVLERHWPRTPIFAVHAGSTPAPPKVQVFIALARAAVSQALR